MLSVEEALDRVLARLPALGAEALALDLALGRVLAEPIVAGRDLPPWDNSSMDGYALRAVDTAGASASSPAALRLLGEIPAGTVAGRALDPGTCYRILTGAPMPSGADAVVPQEEVGRQDEAIVVRRAVSAGEFVRPRGEDVRSGETVLSPGTVLGPAALGMLAAVGRPLVRVRQRPRVAILSTGDELVDLGEPLGAGQIPNTNSFALAAQVREAGGVPVTLGIARDSRTDLEERIRWGLAADVLVSSAGVSVGDRDLVRQVLDKLGAELDFWKVSMRPGKPITFGWLQGRPVFGLPGNPVSSMVTFELFVRPSVRQMAGYARLFRPRTRARVLEPLDNPGSRRGYLRVSLTTGRDGLAARPTGNQGSGVLRSMLLADGLAVVPPDTRIEPGGMVDVMLLREVDADPASASL